jgi:hypothetical protein
MEQPNPRPASGPQPVTTRPAPPPAETEEAIPAAAEDEQGKDWRVDTPQEDEYTLAMVACNGDWLQGILLTREEYVGLKKQLAQLRGLEWPTEASEAA